MSTLRGIAPIHPNTSKRRRVLIAASLLVAMSRAMGGISAPHAAEMRSLTMEEQAVVADLLDRVNALQGAALQEALKQKFREYGGRVDLSAVAAVLALSVGAKFGAVDAALKGAALEGGGDPAYVAALDTARTTLSEIRKASSDGSSVTDIRTTEVGPEATQAPAATFGSADARTAAASSVAASAVFSVSTMNATSAQAAGLYASVDGASSGEATAPPASVTTRTGYGYQSVSPYK